MLLNTEQGVVWMKNTTAYDRTWTLIVFLLSLLLTSNDCFAAKKSLPSITDEQAILNRINEPFKGDLDEIRKRRIIRVLVSYCKTNYFFDHGKARGFEYELMKAYEKF
jgi:ABC-type siderophore export system fused ATPase/permease subunit